MRKYILRIVIALPVVLVLAVLLAWYGLLHTTAGASWLLAVAQKQLPGMLSVEEPEGNLSSGLTLNKLHYADDGVEFGAARIELVLAPGLLPPSLKIESLAIRDSSVWMDGEADDSSAELPDSLALPFPVEIGELVIDRLSYLDENREPQLQLDSMAASASVHEALDLHRLAVEVGELEADAAGRLGLVHPFSTDLAFNSSGTLDLEEESEPMEFELSGDLGGDLLEFSLRSSGGALRGMPSKPSISGVSRSSAGGLGASRSSQSRPRSGRALGGSPPWASRAASRSAIRSPKRSSQSRGSSAKPPPWPRARATSPSLLRHAASSPFDYEFKIVDQAVPNAFSLPGGGIYVSRGLIALANNEDELACVIGHEITHAAHRHAALQQQMSKRLSPLSMGWKRAATLSAYAFGLVGTGHVKVMATAFFAQKNTRTPMWGSLVALIIFTAACAV